MNLEEESHHLSLREWRKLPLRFLTHQLYDSQSWESSTILIWSLDEEDLSKSLIWKEKRAWWKWKRFSSHIVGSEHEVDPNGWSPAIHHRVNSLSNTKQIYYCLLIAFIQPKPNTAWVTAYEIMPWNSKAHNLTAFTDDCYALYTRGNLVCRKFYS